MAGRGRSLRGARHGGAPGGRETLGARPRPAGLNRPLCIGLPPHPRRAAPRRRHRRIRCPPSAGCARARASATFRRPPRSPPLQPVQRFGGRCPARSCTHWRGSTRRPTWPPLRSPLRAERPPYASLRRPPRHPMRTLGARPASTARPGTQMPVGPAPRFRPTAAHRTPLRRYWPRPTPQRMQRIKSAALRLASRALPRPRVRRTSSALLASGYVPRRRPRPRPRRRQARALRPTPTPRRPRRRAGVRRARTGEPFGSSRGKPLSSHTPPASKSLRGGADPSPALSSLWRRQAAAATRLSPPAAHRQCKARSPLIAASRAASRSDPAPAPALAPQRQTRRWPAMTRVWRP